MNFWELIPEWIKNPRPDLILSNNYCVLDFETTNLDKGSPLNPLNDVVSAAVYSNRTKRSAYFSTKQDIEKYLLPILASHDYFVAFNIKFEWGWLAKLFPFTLDTFHTPGLCAQLAMFTLAGNRPEGKLISLDKSLKAFKLPVKDSIVNNLIRTGVCPSEIDPKQLKKYNLQDVKVEDKLWRKVRARIVEKGLSSVFLAKCMYSRVLSDIEQRGIYIDPERCQIVHDNICKEINELEIEWDELTGGVNEKSSQQKSKLFFETLGFKPTVKTPGGNWSTSAAVLDALEPTNETQAAVIKVCKRLSYLRDTLSKILSKFFQAAQDGEPVRFQINQTVARTHRLSSTGFKYKTQGQNIHRAWKPLIRARTPGWLLSEQDQDSLEFRIAGHVSRDRAIRRDILAGKDPHEVSGKIIFDQRWNFSEDSESNTNSPLRQDAKAYTFKPLFGGEYGTEKEVKYYTWFKERYSGLVKAQNRWANEVLATGKLITESGLIFYFPDAKRNKHGRVTYWNDICNYPIQFLSTGDGGCVSLAVILQWYVMKGLRMKSFICNTIHDSSIGEVHPKEKEKYRKVANWAFTEGATEMLKKLYDIELFVPLSAEAVFYDWWKDSEEWKEKNLMS